METRQQLWIEWKQDQDSVFESQEKKQEKVEKEGLKLETHQNWIKASKKIQLKAKRIRIRGQ